MTRWKGISNSHTEQPTSRCRVGKQTNQIVTGRAAAVDSTERTFKNILTLLICSYFVFLDVLRHVPRLKKKQSASCMRRSASVQQSNNLQQMDSESRDLPHRKGTNSDILMHQLVIDLFDISPPSLPGNLCLVQTCVTE